MQNLKKNDIDINKTIVKIKFILKGFRQSILINATIAQTCNFVDVMNENRHKNMNRRQKEMMENRYFIFDDYITKEHITINLNEIKAFSVPFFVDNGDTYDFKVLDYEA